MSKEHNIQRKSATETVIFAIHGASLLEAIAARHAEDPEAYPNPGDLSDEEAEALVYKARDLVQRCEVSPPTPDEDLIQQLIDELVQATLEECGHLPQEEHPPA